MTPQLPRELARVGAHVQYQIDMVMREHRLQLGGMRTRRDVTVQLEPQVLGRGSR